MLFSDLLSFGKFFWNGDVTLHDTLASWYKIEDHKNTVKARYCTTHMCIYTIYTCKHYKNFTLLRQSLYTISPI